MVKSKVSDRRSLIIYVLGIVIIAIIIVYIVSNTKINYGWGGLLPVACTASPTYSCQSPIYYHQTGNITIELGQNTGTNWTSVSFVFVNQGTRVNLSTGIPVISFTSYPANTSYSSIGLSSGNRAHVSLPVLGVTPPVLVGSSLSGTIWARYIILGNTSPQYVQIATLNIKAS